VGLQIGLREIDRRIWDEELAGFVPDRVIDAHTHVYDWTPEVWRRAGNAAPEGPFATYPLADWETLEAIDRMLFPGREVHRIAFGNPLQVCPLDQGNDYLAEQAGRDAKSAGLMLVRPELTGEAMAERVARQGFAGAKPYRMHAVSGDAVECRICDFLPEYQIEVLDRFGLMVMLHLSKSRSIADPENLEDLEALTRKYPRVQWVLAHCARSYYDRPLLLAAERLREMPNLWYEISSVCDADAMDVLLSVAGPERVMYGSDDVPVGITRGKYITFGYAWAELNEGNHTLGLSHCNPEMTFVRYESLRAFRRAVRRHGYGRAEIEKLFCGNAERLIAMTGGR